MTLPAPSKASTEVIAIVFFNMWIPFIKWL